MIVVIAGVNGAGKSSVVGELIRRRGGEYYNPDEMAQLLLKRDPSLSLSEANGEAWQRGYDGLKRAIKSNHHFVFESTLGATTIPNLLFRAGSNGLDIKIVYCGLNSPQLHIDRVAARVSRGGHDIPEDKIRSRYSTSLNNIVLLIPVCHSITVWDNSSPLIDGKPNPDRIFSVENRHFTQQPNIYTPKWAQPLAGIALQTFKSL